MELIKKISPFEYPCISRRRYEWSDCGLKQHSMWGVLIYSASSRTESPDNRNQESSTKLYVLHNNITECVFIRRRSSGRALKNKNKSVKQFSAKKLIPNWLNYINTTRNQFSNPPSPLKGRAHFKSSCFIMFGIRHRKYVTHQKWLHVHGREVRVLSISLYHGDKCVLISSQTRKSFSLWGKNCIHWPVHAHQLCALYYN